MKWSKRSLQKETLTLDSKSVSVLGPGLELIDCEVVSETTSRGIILAGLTMVGGEFKQRKNLVNMRFDFGEFKRVKFTGVYRGCMFGAIPPRNGSLDECDFTEARLEHCAFFNSETRSLRFPVWPHFVLDSPSLSSEAMLSLEWPSKMAAFIEAYVSSIPECNAIVSDANVLATISGLGLYEVRGLLERVPAIEIVD